MTTTAIRLDDELMARVAAAADRAGTTAHTFILDAIARSVEHNELDSAFHAIADQRWANVLKTGKTVPWNDTKAWLAATSRGRGSRKPVPRSLAR